MSTIKRYPNRKLYDTEAKQYITLDGIANLIRVGQDVRVVDYATGEDLTALTLAQIMFDQEKKAGGFVPHSVLSGLIQAGGKTLSALAFPLGRANHVDAEIARRIGALVQVGELSQEDGLELEAKLTGPRAQPASDKPLPSEREIEQVLNRRGIPTRADLQRLAQQVEVLAARLDQIISLKPPAPARPKRARRKRPQS